MCFCVHDFCVKKWKDARLIQFCFTSFESVILLISVWCYHHHQVVSTLLFSPPFFLGTSTCPQPETISFYAYKISILHCLEYCQTQTSFLHMLQNWKAFSWQERRRSSDDVRGAGERRRKKDSELREGHKDVLSVVCHVLWNTEHLTNDRFVMELSKLSHTRWENPGSQKLLWPKSCY